ncbi:transporter substrate-binding domain-containing protein [Rheinheimera baltica]|uniref:Transporter substrate-binding domain-containing protein n=1 Tax=Rheinheimera baltica TaxID=67576 RepID=A0ABT9HX80_9GAMM|nr:transporter substrate-binding domain-containing protein [Rheinheimera baltica]MDP5135734.1 transporter substrate-binding domain-containing protein [Rheinheimera baltica]
MKICTALLFVLFPWFSQAKTVFSVCYEGSGMEPFISAGIDGSQPVGFLVEMLNAAAAPLEITLQYQQAPWLRCQKMVQENQLNATLAMIWSPERALLYRFPDQQSSTELSNRYLWQAEYPVLHTVDKPFSLAQYQPQFGISAPLGYIVEQWLQHKGWLSPYKFTPDEGLKMVAEGKLDGYSVERLIGRYQLQQLGLTDKVAVSDDNLLVKNWHIVFNPDFYANNTELVEQFWFNLIAARKHLEATFPQTQTTSPN